MTRTLSFTLMMFLGLGCATAKSADEMLLPGFGGDSGPGGGSSPQAAAPPAPRPAMQDQKYGFSWSLPGLWEFKDPALALPALANFDGGKAIALRTDRSAQALVLVIPLEADLEASNENLGVLEKIAREKSRDQKVAVESLTQITLDGHPGILLVGRQGGRNSARMDLVFVHAGSRRFELQCRRSAEVDHACNTIFDDLKIVDVRP